MLYLFTYFSIAYCISYCIAYCIAYCLLLPYCLISDLTNQTKAKQVFGSPQKVLSSLTWQVLRNDAMRNDAMAEWHSGGTSIPRNNSCCYSTSELQAICNTNTNMFLQYMGEDLFLGFRMLLRPSLTILDGSWTKASKSNRSHKSVQKQ